jgi:hypothetical protein
MNLFFTIFSTTVKKQVFIRYHEWCKLLEIVITN